MVEDPPSKWGPITVGKPSFRIEADQLAMSDDALERDLIKEALLPNGVDIRELMESAQGAAEAIELSLQDKGLLESPESFRAAKWWPTLMISAVWLLGVAKLFVGISQGRPVGFLLFSLVALAGALFALSKRPRRTLAGDRLLKRIESQHEKPSFSDFGSGESLPIPDLALATGLFGMTAIDHPEVAKLNTAIQTVPASHVGIGCGGGGCGGGGCGGGGCGGGGCGGGCGGCGG